MNNTNQIRQLLRRKVVAAKNAALHTNDFSIPVEDRYIISMSIQEIEQILDLLPCETCNGTGEVNPTPDMSFLIYRDLRENPSPCPDCN